MEVRSEYTQLKRPNLLCTLLPTCPLLQVRSAAEEQEGALQPASQSTGNPADRSGWTGTGHFQVGSALCGNALCK